VELTTSLAGRNEALAVFDLGKTNSKLFVFDGNGAIIAEERTRPVWYMTSGIRVLADDALSSWMSAALTQAIARHDVGGVMFSCHGCTFALVGGDRLVHPVLDYEQELPADIAAWIEPLMPAFEETFSPRLPLGLNFARHILWLARRDPQAFEAAEAILCYPQFWSWRFSGEARSEVSYLGCHSHLWAPLKKDFSSLVDKQGWRRRMPPFARAGSAVGFWRAAFPDGTMRTLTVHNGVHDSNASLYFYRAIGLIDFTLISTGTWVVIFNPACPLDALDRNRDMLANVTVDAEVAPTIRFMGGREYEIASGGWNKPVSREAVEAVVAKGIFTLPSFAAGGPLPGIEGHFVGPEPSAQERAASALLYVALMTDLSLDLIRSQNVAVIDGGLVKTGLYAGLLAQLRPSQSFKINPNAEGSAFGAAALAFEATGRTPFANSCEPVRRADFTGLDSYRSRWRRGVESARSASTFRGQALRHAADNEGQ
jgi:sugar (pentulose or hexulose) kinase